jgi:hypothetical protein
MIDIDLKKSIKEQFERNGLCYPKLKGNGKYGLKGSSMMDYDNEKQAENEVLKYLEQINVIIIREATR